MDPAVSAPGTPSIDAEAFVRFCYRRRRVGWPELYDEMCAVATRGLFHGMGRAELAELGIGFSLFETPALARLVSRVVAEEHDRRVRLAAPLRSARTSAPDAGSPATAVAQPEAEPAPAADEPEPRRRHVLAVA